MLLPGANIITGIIMSFFSLVFAGVVGFLVGALFFKVHSVLIKRTKLHKKYVSGARIKVRWWLHSRHFWRVGVFLGTAATIYAFIGPLIEIFTR